MDLRGIQRALPLPTTAPRAVRVVLALQALGIAVLTALLALPGDPSRAVVDALFLSLDALATTVVVARALVRRPGGGAWRVQAAAMCFGLAGDATLRLYVLPRGLAAPSISDALYVGYYGLGVVALALLTRVAAGGLRLADRLDGALAGVGASAVATWAVFTALDGTVGDAPPAVVLAYPVADALLLGAACGALAALGSRMPRFLRLVVVGLAVATVGDAAYAVGAPLPGVASVLFPIATTLYACASWLPTAPVTRSGRRSASLAVPLLCAAACTALLGLQALRPLALPPLLLAAGAVALALTRLALTVREAHALAGSHDLARTDELTGLGNRRRLLLSLAAACDAPEPQLALLVLDLDRFKEVNDALGHDLGDQLLRRVGARLADGLRPGDELARLGGDEFAVVLPGAHARAAHAAAERLRERLAEPIALDGLSLRVDVSVGIAVAPDHGTTPARLLHHADVAMYRAKRRQEGVAAFHADVDAASSERLHAVAALREALDAGDLRCHYQPVVEVATGRMRSAEALLRWDRPGHGPVPPGVVVSLAEHAGLMRRVTQHVLDVALADCADWRRRGHDVGVAVNLSAADLLDGSLPGHVAERLAHHGLPACALALEVTESTFMVDPERAALALDELRATGVGVAIDDFGTGYSSLAYLQRLPADVLKLDRALVAPVVEDLRTRAIVASTVALAGALGLAVCAEGIEDAATLGEVEGLGAAHAQGYFISRPVAAEALVTWLEGAQARAPVAG